MDAERLRAFLLTLPHVLETEQWGGLLFWIGDKAIGGKMFAMLPLDRDGNRVLSYPAGPVGYNEILERDGFFAGSYVALMHWFAAERWSVFRNAEWQDELRAAHTLTFAKLALRTRAILALPIAERRRLIAERKTLLAAKSRKSAPGKIVQG